MSWKLIGSGNKSNVSSLSTYDSQFSEGEIGYTRLTLAKSVPSQAIWLFQESLKAGGVDLTKNLQTTQSGGKQYIHIHHRRGVPVLVIIAAALAVAIVIFAVLSSWGAYKWIVGDVAGGGLSSIVSTVSWQMWGVVIVAVVGVIIASVLIVKSGKSINAGVGRSGLNASVGGR